MPYSRITHTAHGAEAIAYARGIDGQGHNGADHRNDYVLPVNMLPDSVRPYQDQMADYWRLASDKNKNQVLRGVVSYSKKELNPDSPEDILKAAHMGREIVQTGYPDRQAVVFVQTDGKGGCVHLHILINNVSLTDHKGATDEQKTAAFFRRTSDTVAAKYINPDTGKQADVEKQSQTERAAVGYVWKDDLKARILQARDAAVDMQDFYKQLTAHGVEGTEKTRRKSQEKYITFELTDTAGFSDGKIPENLKSRSYKLGGDFEYSALEQAIKQRRPQLAPTQAEIEKPEKSPEKAPEKPKMPGLETIAAQPTGSTSSRTPQNAPERPKKAPESDFDGPRHTRHTREPEKPAEPSRTPRAPKKQPVSDYAAEQARRAARLQALMADIDDAAAQQRSKQRGRGPEF